jgi:enoyl-CoA hydratase
MELHSTLFEIKERIAYLSIHRPLARHAIDLQVVQEFHSVLDHLEEHSQIDSLIIASSGDKAFASGADIAQLQKRKAPEALRGINSSLFQRIEQAPFPVIAAIQGYALGGGCELALACDIRICGKSSKFGQPEVTLGIIPGAGACHRLARLVGLGKAKELIFTGEMISAEEALKIGLVNSVVEDGKALESAEILARKIAKNSTLAVQIAKATINAVGRPDHAIAYDLERFGQAILFESQEKDERMRAFLERNKKSN